LKFKDILAWCKAHIIIVVSVLLIIVILPVAAFFSMSWHKSIIEGVQKRADAEMSKTKVNVTYALPQVDIGGQAITKSDAPNAKLTEFFSKTREQMLAEVELLAKKGEDFNKGVGPQAQSVGRGEYKFLVDGLFPRPKLTPEQEKQNALREVEGAILRDFEDRLLGKGGQPTPYAGLLASVRAGQPPNPEMVAEIVRDLNQREREKVTAGNRQLTPEETERLNQLLKDRRLGEYRANARAIGVYANTEAFATGSTGGKAESGSGWPINYAPADSIPANLQNRARMFLWQWDIWAKQDIFNAIRMANTDASGKPTGVDQSVVKRIIRLEVFQPEDMKPIAGESARESDAGDPFAEAETPTAVPSPPIDRARSLAGWIRAGGNEVYEVRRARLTAIVSSARINQFIDALQRTNFIAVSDVDLASVDVWDDLRQGYFYGDEHVVRATFVIDSAWLNSWLLPKMPDELLVALGRTPPQPTDPGSTGEAAPAGSGPN
jgi:hypothetical protein